MDIKVSQTYEQWVEAVKHDIHTWKVAEINYLLNWCKNASYFDSYKSMIEVLENELMNREEGNNKGQRSVLPGKCGIQL